MLRGLDLFSGIGGLTIALADWVEPIAYCESDRYAQAVLVSRMSTENIPRAPIWDDVRTLRGEQLHAAVDIIYGGFPCQDISQAGRGIGLDGERSGLFFEVVRLAGEIKPQIIFLENVPAIRTRGLRQVIGALTDLGYDCRWTSVSAAELGAPHLRKRWFLLAHIMREGRRIQQGRRRGSIGQESLANPAGTRCLRGKPGNGQEENGTIKSTRTTDWRDFTASGNGQMANTLCSGWFADGAEQSRKTLGAGSFSESPRSSWWAVEPQLGRVAHGIPFRVDRLRGLGNSVVPAQAREAFMRLMGLTDSRTEDKNG